MSLAGRMALALLLAAAPTALSAAVEITIRDDGTKVMVNEPGETRSLRLAGRLMKVPRPEIAHAIESHAAAHELEPRLIQALVQAESGYDIHAVSSKGAVGLMQLLPTTAAELAVEDLFDIEQNVRGGVAYLRRMLDRFGDLTLALAAYNAGPEAVARHAGVPPYPETRAYVRKVMALYTGEDNELVGRKVDIVRGPDNRILLTTGGSGRP